ncbi:hypothetical protein ACFOY2_04985 [Nonomuraea purpurea]|uniref:DNA-binding phage zinc finger domain-containing protein n=1 Tax=Nonomuraea purpurea TaxID=1849276 RepID=A0ABV8G155_9ACTN
MTPVEAVKFVQFVSALWPQQRLEDETPDAWYAAGLKDVEARDAAEAATRLANHKVFISLAELLSEVKALRTERISRSALPAPAPELADRPVDYQAALKDALAEMAQGFALPKQIMAKVEPSTEYTEIRGADHDPARIAAIRVPCPWPPCKALPGAVCVNADGRRLSAPAHEARLKAAGLAEIEGSP